MTTQHKLATKLRLLSHSARNLTDAEVLNQWYPLKTSYADNHCICGVAIRENCHIKNIYNQRTTIVGNVCINLFGTESMKAVFNHFAKIKNNQKRNGQNDLACQNCFGLRCICSDLVYDKCAYCDTYVKKSDMDSHCKSHHNPQYELDSLNKSISELAAEIIKLRKLVTLTFGKYNGKSLSDIFKTDKKYYKWLFRPENSFRGSFQYQIRSIKSLVKEWQNQKIKLNKLLYPVK